MIIEIPVIILMRTMIHYVRTIKRNNDDGLTCGPHDS
jgi:hypothetical protein